MRISDWSSDVCSSDLVDQPLVERALDPRHAMAVGVDEAEHMRREGQLRIEAFLFAREVEADIADRVPRRDLIGQRPAADVGRARPGTLLQPLGQASWRARVCTTGEVPGAVVTLNKNKK